MSSHLIEIFEYKKLIRKIRKRLPYLFHLAELESSRAGQIGMEVGSLRERIVVSLLIYKFGEKNVETEIPITEPEVDVRLSGQPVSIKTITSKGFGGVKLIWTVDARKAKEFHGKGDLNMVSKKRSKRKRCKNYGRILDAIWFTALMTEEWSWNGKGYNECTARHSLITDPDANVICPHCEYVVGTGLNFGFGAGYK